MHGISPPTLHPEPSVPVPAPPLPEPQRPIVNRRRFLLSSTFAAAGLLLYSNEIARHEVQTNFRTFVLRNLHPVFTGYRIVQISDIHLDEYTEDFFLNEIITRVNALAPDMVLITGDFCSRAPLPFSFGLAAARRCAALLTRIACKNRFGILGNHDAVVGPQKIRAFLEDNGTPILVNQYLPIERQGQRFWLAGLDDTLSGHPNIELTLPPAALLAEAPIILMSHEPDYVDTIYTHDRGRGVDLVLSGHTHGGQIRLPFSGPLLLPPAGKLYPEGHYLLGDLQLYVNRGLGTVGVPLRLNCPPEITVATLRPA